MKKIILLILFVIPIFPLFEIEQTHAAGTIQVKTTSYVPGAGCSKFPNEKGEHTCSIPKGFSGVMLMVGDMIKYFTYIVALAAVLFIVINGILYSMAGVDQGLKDGAKKRITQTLLGLVVLLLSGVILNAIAPWIYQL